MKLPGAGYLRELSEARRFRALPAESRAIVFYAEDASSGVHYEPILRYLTGPLGREIAYLTSSPSDPILTLGNDKIHAFCVGHRVFRTWVLMDLVADVMVMTLPDLERFQVKRSRVHPVHYVYVFHSMVSTHMIYRERAFDHFDAILAVGPHHLREIRAAEEIRDLPAKNLIEHGYGRLDAILEQSSGARPVAGGDPRRVLIAPSWDPQGLLETRAIELVENVLAGGHHVTVRPHPMTGRKWPKVIRALERYRDRSRCAGGAQTQRFVLETDIVSQESLHRSDVMISDWSGVALEYAFGLERPVLFVDVPRKVRNAEYERIGCEPVEASLRAEIGEVISLEKLDGIGDSIDRLCAEPDRFRERIRQVRDRSIFNLGRSGIVGAEAIARLADERAAEHGG